MNPARLLQHFDRISEAPDAIPRLRRFILDLAVRGKLVEQDPNDEPASELLNRLEAEKARFVKEQKIKKEPISFDEEDVPFSLPASWIWARFIEVAAIESNLVKPASFPDHPHIAPDNIESRTGRLLDYQTIRESKVFSAKHRFFPGHIVYSKIRPNLAKAALVGIEGLCSADMYPIRPFIDRAFLLKFMLSDVFVQQSIKEDNRVAMPKINQESLSKIFVAVPPLAEQHRIVAKVDELMALCDQLEAAKTEREQSRDRLVVASLHHLNQPADAEEVNTPEAFHDYARFYFNHLPRLTTRPEHIKQLRQTILNLAVCGKLVPQGPNDEPASELLKRIQKHKVEFAKSGRAEHSSAIEILNHDEVPFMIPSGWVGVSFGSIMISRDGERIPVSKEERVGRAKVYDYYGASGVIDKIDNYLFDKPLLLIGEDGANLINRSTPIAFIARGKYWVNNHAHVLDGISEGFLRYIELHINAIDLKPYVTGTAQPKMNQAKMNSIPIALPPLAEQHRIVAKVDELMAQCDQLEAQLTTTQADSRHLLEAVLHEVLDPALEKAA